MKPRSAASMALIIRSLLVWAVLGAIWWLDHPVAGVQRAEFFGWLVPFLVSVGKEVGGVVATYLFKGIQGALSALGGALRWTIGQLKSFVVSTGAMFAKIWRSLEGFWKNVIRRALVKLHDQYIRLRNWLRYIFKPLIRFLDRVRDKIHEIYTRFVRPVLDALDTARKVLDILTKLHIPFARQLETYLAKTEQWITAQYARLNAELNKVVDTINGILTFDGYLQRFLFLRTLERDVFYVWRALANAGARPVTAEQHQRIKHLTMLPDDADLLAQFTAYWKGEPNTVGEWADASVVDATSEWTPTA
jgi:hypothetical protein